MPQLAQNPSTSPGCPSRPRPTGRSHTPQNRLLSATIGFFSTADAGSLAGTGGMSTSPAPRCPRDDRMLPERVRRLPVRPVVPVRPKLPEPAAEPVPGAAAGAGAIPQVSQYPPSIVPPHPGRLHFSGPAAAAGVAVAAGAGESGAMPQVSQYPPSIVPPQPGRVHLVAVVVIAVAPSG